VPINVLGVNTASQAAIAYVNGTTSWAAVNTMDNVGASITGTLLEGWAGPIKIAAGGEFRQQVLHETSSVTDNIFNATGLRVGANGTTPSPGTQAWTKNITAPAYGRQSVYEGDLELDVPLLRDLPLVRTLSASAAGRFTHYSTSGSVQTWRLGLEWQPAPGLNIRATRSRDIRAPTLFDLYQGQTATISGYTDFLTGANGQILNISKGNPDLVPEVARNITVGATYQPSFARNLTLSFDYFDVQINNAIGAVSGLTTSVEKLCIASVGTSPLCDLVVRPGPITDTSGANAPTANIKQNENIAKLYTRGFVVGFDYELNGARIGIPGNANLHVQWTHEPVLKNRNLPGTITTNTAGTALAPVDRIASTFGYEIASVSFAVTGRYFSSFHYSPDPTLTVAQPPSSAYFQTDFNLAYDFPLGSHTATAFLNVNNAFNVHGGLYEASSSNPGLIYPAAPFADQIGRYFTFGIRIGV
jgi:outer membrane receptor protein involved in Fe transport